jgi:short subunit dehydrogenase-like uncharacterized protein
MIVLITVLKFALSISFLRPTVDRVLPKPGEGPSRKTLESGSFEHAVYCMSENDKIKVKVTVAGKADPGYLETAKMLSESAFTLAELEDNGIGGILTPSTAMGQKLVDRLIAAGMTFRVDE